MFDSETVLPFLVRQSYILGGLFIAITFFAWLTRGKTAFAWSREKKKSAAINLVFLIFNSVILLKMFIIAVGSFKMAFNALGLPVIPKSFWAGWPLLAKAFIVMVVYDFCKYWIHRYLHGSWRWPMHAVHHSDPELQYLSWSRGHILETIFSACALIVMATWLGLTPNEIVSLALIQAIHQYYVHANLDWSHGFLRHIIVSPRFHRWHHADTAEAIDKNFAEIFPVWDKIFGTYYCPGPAYDIPTGFKNKPDEDFITLLAYPFTEWFRIVRKKLSGGSKSSLADMAE